MSKHSPGPWSAATNWIVIDAEGRVVCEVKGDQVGDASVIAEAPELLALVKRYRAICNLCEFGGDSCWRCQDADALIARIEGANSAPG